MMTSASAAAPDFESCGGYLRPLHDGHIPETFNREGQWIHYPEMEFPAKVFVHDNVLPPSTVQALYDKTVSEKQPWGTYVTLCQVQQLKNERSNNNDDLIVHVVKTFLEKMTNGQAEPTVSSATDSMDNIPSLQDVHGVAVWALASEGTEVQYHVDYAELVRYEHNVLATPLWAGTLQCTRPQIKGGEFAVNLGGMQHYETHGYKGKSSGDARGGWKSPQDASVVDCNKDTEWVTIPYQFNRMIQHDGHLPHLSAPFTSGETARRVIVGFNVFRHDVGPLVAQAPEHSDAFRRRIQCQSLLKSNLSLENVKSNKALTKLLVLAKRAKVKEDLKIAQDQLNVDLRNLLKNGGSQSVASIAKQLARSDGMWPSNVDVQVHVEYCIRNGTLKCDSENVSQQILVFLP